MKNSLARIFRFRAVRVGAFVSTLIVLVVAFSAVGRSADGDSALAEQQLQGTWVLVGTPGDVGDVPARGGTLAVRSNGRWMEMEVDPRSGIVRKASGGTYRLVGENYEETVDYGSESVGDWVGKTYMWKVTVERDTLTRVGLGNPWTHVWKRVK